MIHHPKITRHIPPLLHSTHQLNKNLSVPYLISKEKRWWDTRLDTSLNKVNGR